MSITHPADPIEPAWNEYEYEPILEVGDSWRAQNLLDHEANPEPGPTIGGALYAGKRHLCSGESESGKSWLALAWSIEVLQAGGYCVYIDHEMGRSMTLERLRVLGATDDEVIRFRYADPTEPAQHAAPQIAELVVGARLVIIDATIGSLALHALDENSTTDIERWYQRVVDPLRASGAAVVVLDHVTKNPETRGKYAIGSQRKVGASDVHLSVECISPFSRTRAGKAKITVKKDRPGHLARPTLGLFTLDPAGIPSTYTWTPYTDEQTHDDEGHFRPTMLMQRVSEYLEQNSPASKKTIEDNVTGKRDYVRQAIEALIREGNISTQEGFRKGGKSLEHTLVSPFTDDENAPPSPPRPTLAPPSPQNNGSNPRPLAPTPTRGGEGQGEGTGQKPPGPSPLLEPCPSCSSRLGTDPWSTAGGTYCCHDCARGEACACKYLQETTS